MALTDWQFGAADETTYSIPVTPTKFFEYDSESIAETYGRTEGDPLRTGSSVIRSDRFTPYFSGAAGSVNFAVLTKSFGYWLKHMMGTVATTGPAETSVYTHTGTEADFIGKSFTAQVNRPLNPSGTAAPFTYSGGKVTEWTLSNSVDENLMLELQMDFAKVATATALATASYPTNMDNLTWAGGVVSIGGAAYDVTDFSLTVNNGYNVDRRQIRANTDKKEPVSTRREPTFSISADFDSMANRNRAAATTRAGALATLSATWNGPTLLGTTLYPSFTVSAPAARFDEWSGATEGTDAISQDLSGVLRWDGTPFLTCTYKTADATP